MQAKTEWSNNLVIVWFFAKFHWFKSSHPTFFLQKINLDQIPYFARCVSMNASVVCLFLSVSQFLISMVCRVAIAQYQSYKSSYDLAWHLNIKHHLMVEWEADRAKPLLHTKCQKFEHFLGLLMIYLMILEKVCNGFVFINFFKYSLWHSNHAWKIKFSLRKNWMLIFMF